MEGIGAEAKRVEDVEELAADLEAAAFADGTLLEERKEAIWRQRSPSSQIFVWEESKLAPLFVVKKLTPNVKSNKLDQVSSGRPIYGSLILEGILTSLLLALKRQPFSKLSADLKPLRATTLLLEGRIHHATMSSLRWVGDGEAQKDMLPRILDMRMTVRPWGMGTESLELFSRVRVFWTNRVTEPC